MKWLELLAFMLQGTLEMTGAVAFSLALAGVPLRWKRIVPAGVALAAIIYVLRQLPLPFGVHTIAGLLLIVFFIAKSTNVSATRSFVVVFVSGVTLALLEIFLYEFLFAITKVEPQVAMANRALWSLFGLPQAIIMIFLALLITRYKKPAQGAWKR
ncbi:MAG: hypothetical protein AB1556_10870 [Bacillota bacterium]